MGDFWRSKQPKTKRITVSASDIEHSRWTGKAQAVGCRNLGEFLARSADVFCTILEGDWITASQQLGQEGREP